MEEELQAQVKYIYLDVVGFTKNRSVEAQSEIIVKLNQIVSQSISVNKVNEEEVIYLPTGDGICISLINIIEPYDIYMKITLDILQLIDEYNDETEDKMRKFQVRIGINSNIDNIITDINDKTNVAGAGINYAQRIMNCADGNQVLVGQAIYETLYQREKYMKSFRKFSAPIKHLEELDVYQYIEKEKPGLNTEIPEQFKLTQKREPKLTKIVAYYFAHAIKNKEFIKSKKGLGKNAYTCMTLLWFLASDSVGYSDATDVNPYKPKLYDVNNTDISWIYYHRIDFWILSDLCDSIIDKHLSPYFRYFETGFGSPHLIFISAEGMKKLKEEWPRIWDEFDLDQYMEK